VDRWSRLSRRTDAEPWSSRARAAVARFPHGDAAADTEAVDACIFDETWPGGPARPASPPAAPVITAHVA
jgi:hypothetical protein